MGIVINALAISVSSLTGSIFKSRISNNNLGILGISIIITSLVGFFENIYNVTEGTLESAGLMIVLFCLILGNILGEKLNIDGKLSHLVKCKSNSLNSVIDATLFFGVGGLQICGPILLAVNGDNSQLILKSIIDIPFAIIFGATYGKIVMLSALPVATMQIVIAMIAFFTNAFLSNDLISQLCSMGYIILFFSGFNLLVDSKHKINNVNMVPGIFMIILFHSIMGIKEMIL